MLVFVASLLLFSVFQANGGPSDGGKDMLTMPMFFFCVENCACLSRLKKINEYTGNSEQNCLQGFWETISLDKMALNAQQESSSFASPNPSYRLLSPRTVRLAIRKQYFDRYKSHSRPLRASLPISGLKREIETIGRLVPWKLQCVEKKDTKYLLVSRESILLKLSSIKPISCYCTAYSILSFES